MGASFLNIHSTILRGAIGFVAVLAITTAHAQILRVTAANASNSGVYDLPLVLGKLTGATTPVNTDANKFVSIRSLAYVRNLSPPGSIDLLVTDASRGVVARYANITPYGDANPPRPEAATIVWSTACGPGPAAPDGISVDANGNVFVVSSAPGSGTAGLWVFPNAASQPAGTPPCSVTPRLVDSGFNGTFEQLLEETLFAFAITNPNQDPNTPTSTADLLVLASSPTPAVFAYDGQELQAFLSCTVSPCPGSVTPRLLISQVQVPVTGCASGLSSFPTGLTPGGMDFWPPDNSLLISTGGGSILRYSFPGGVPCRLNDFADGLGNGKFKVKTGWQNHQANAFVANNNGGDILQFTGPGIPLATVTSGVQHPQGLVVSNLNNTPATACQAPDSCDPLGGVGGVGGAPNVLKHTIIGAGDLSNKFLIETPCIVEVDPRIQSDGSCKGTLPVSQVCAGYGTTVIPETLCGGSGTPSVNGQPHGFALIKTDNTVDSSLNGALVANDSSPNLLLAGPANPLCPQSVLAWAPLESEGSVVEDVGGMRPMLEMTNFCDAGSTTKGNSIFGIGLVLNLPNSPLAYVDFVNQKFTNLLAAVNAANINKSVQQSLLKCIQGSQADFNATPPIFGTALTDLLACDAQVVKGKTKFTPRPGIDANPYGEIRGRIGNVYLWISYHFAGRGTPTQWPLH